MRCLDPMCIIHCPPVPLMYYLTLRSPVGSLSIEFIQHAHHNQPYTDRCMSIEPTGMLKKPPSTECTGAADPQTREFKRLCREYMLKHMNDHTIIKRTRATDSSPSQASTHRSLLVHSVHMPPAGPSDTERGMGGWDVHRDQEDAAGSPQTYSRPPDLQAYENHELRPDT